MKYNCCMPTVVDFSFVANCITKHLMSVPSGNSFVSPWISMFSSTSSRETLTLEEKQNYFPLEQILSEYYSHGWFSFIFFCAKCRVFTLDVDVVCSFMSNSLVQPPCSEKYTMFRYDIAEMKIIGLTHLRTISNGGKWKVGGLVWTQMFSLYHAYIVAK